MDKKLLNKAIKLAVRGYQVQVQKEDGHDGKPVWVAYVPEMPSCVAQADSPERAKEALKVVREDYIFLRLKRNVPVPDPEPMPRDGTMKIEGYARPSYDSATTLSNAVSSRSQPVRQSIAFTQQPAAAFISQNMKQPLR